MFGHFEPNRYIDDIHLYVSNYVSELRFSQAAMLDYNSFLFIFIMYGLGFFGHHKLISRTPIYFD